MISRTILLVGDLSVARGEHAAPGDDSVEAERLADLLRHKTHAASDADVGQGAFVRPVVDAALRKREVLRQLLSGEKALTHYLGPKRPLGLSSLATLQFDYLLVAAEYFQRVCGRDLQLLPKSGLWSYEDRTARPRKRTSISTSRPAPRARPFGRRLKLS